MKTILAINSLLYRLVMLLFKSALFCRVSEEQRKKFTQLTEILMHGITFSIPNCAVYNASNIRFVSQCKSCQTFVYIVHFPAIKALEEKNI